MCGILFQFSKNKVNEKLFKKSLLLQKHRGPDHTGITKVNDNLIFGHVRLSIIDLPERSNQPMISSDTSNIIIFNGEIYNYIEIKNNLKQQEVIFETEGDTEVLLKAIEKNGISAIKEFNGAWSFVFYERKNNKIIISRDRYGKKPFYYYKDNENLIISSEIKSIFSLLSKKKKC